MFTYLIKSRTSLSGVLSHRRIYLFNLGAEMFSRDLVNNAHSAETPTLRAFREVMKFNESQRGLGVSLKIWLFNVNDNNRDVIVRAMTNRIVI